MKYTTKDSNTDVISTPRKAALFCLGVFFLYLCTLRKGFESWNVDTFYYLTLAKSLISLDGYKIFGTPHTKLPFGFPVLLAPVVGIFGYNSFVIQVFLVILAALALFVCFIFLRRTFGGKMADIAFLLTGTSYFFWGFNCNYIVSEIPYFLFSLLALIVAQKSLKDGNDIIRNSVLLSFLILASYFTRTVGISLLAAVIVLCSWDIIKRRKGSLARLCVILFICGSAVLSWFAREKILSTTIPTRTYEQDLERKTPIDTMAGSSNVAKKLLKLKIHLTNHSRDITATMTSIPYLSFNLRFWWYLICLIFIIGLLYSLFKTGSIVEWYLLFYIGIFVVWPTESVRFWYPVIPFIFFYFLKAIYLAKKKFEGNNGKTYLLPIAYCLLPLSGYFLVFIPLSEKQYYESGAVGYYQLMITFLFVILYFLLLVAQCSLHILTVVRPYLLKLVFAIIILHNLSMVAYRTYLKHQDYGLKWAGKLYFQEIGGWLRQNSNKNDVVMCDDPVALGVFSERSCTRTPEITNTQTLIEKIQREKVSYILIENAKKSSLKNLREIEVLSMLNFREIMQREGNQLLKIEQRK